MKFAVKLGDEYVEDRTAADKWKNLRIVWTTNPNTALLFASRPQADAWGIASRLLGLRVVGMTLVEVP